MRTIAAAICGVALILATPAGAIDIATWNIKHLGWDDEGRDWPRTAAVIAQYEFIALQEVMSEGSVTRLERALEARTGAEWSSLVSQRSVGRSSRYQEYYAFLWQPRFVRYDGAAVLYLDNRDWFAREPFAANFETTDGRWRWSAASIHVIYGDSVGEREREASRLDEYVLWLERSIAEGRPVLLMGDFNLEPDSEGFRALLGHYTPLVTRGATTLSTREGRYANLYDQIFVPRALDWPIRNVRIARFPVRFGISNAYAREHISDHVPIAFSLPSEGEAPGTAPGPLPAAPESTSRRTTASKHPQRASIELVCVHPDAAGRESENLDDEYVVIANATSDEISLVGWTLLDAAGHSLPLSGALGAGQMRRITSKEFGSAVWNNTGDIIELLDASARRVLKAAYPEEVSLCN
jgi:endonuclease/exonuclease/phosphatase family metal-dependent hydrolase